jgi:hypothetical protein
MYRKEAPSVKNATQTQQSSIEDIRGQQPIKACTFAEECKFVWVSFRLFFFEAVRDLTVSHSSYLYIFKKHLLTFCFRIQAYLTPLNFQPRICEGSVHNLCRSAKFLLQNRDFE